MKETSPSDSDAPRESHNPFATRFIRPDRMAFLFPEGRSPYELVDQLVASAWHGQIVGPHGTGKTTLLYALTHELRSRDRAIELFRLSEGQRRLPAGTLRSLSWDRSTQVVVDGFEQLHWWSRRRLLHACRQRGSGLLVTTHQDAGLPTLFATSVTVETACNIVAQLLGDSKVTFTETEVEAALRSREGNLREALFELYDLYERRVGSD